MVCLQLVFTHNKRQLRVRKNVYRSLFYRGIMFMQACKELSLILMSHRVVIQYSDTFCLHMLQFFFFVQKNTRK